MAVLPGDCSTGEIQEPLLRNFGSTYGEPAGSNICRGGLGTAERVTRYSSIASVTAGQLYSGRVANNPGLEAITQQLLNESEGMA